MAELIERWVDLVSEHALKLRERDAWRYLPHDPDPEQPYRYPPMPAVGFTEGEGYPVASDPCRAEHQR